MSFNQKRVFTSLEFIHLFLKKNVLLYRDLVALQRKSVGWIANDQTNTFSYFCWQFFEKNVVFFTFIFENFDFFEKKR